MSRSREELKEIARKILDYKRSDHSELLNSLTPEEQVAITPLFREVTEEQLAKDKAELELERAEHEAFMKREREKDKEYRKFIAETDRFIAKVKAETERQMKRNTQYGTFFLLSGKPS